MDNTANNTKITLVQGDTQLNPAMAVTVTQQFTSNANIVAVAGPAGSQEVEAVGGLMGRAGMAFISGSATAVALTTGKYPTFFRVVSKDSVQGPQDANYIVKTLKPKALMIVDDQEAYSTGLVSAMMPIFQAAGIKVDHESVSQKVTDFSSLVAKVTPAESVVVLPWQVAANAQQFGRDLAQEHKTARDLRHGRPVLAGYVHASPARTCPRSARTSPRSRPTRRSPGRPRRSTGSSVPSVRPCSRPRT